MVKLKVFLLFILYRNTGSKTGHIAGTYGYVDYARISADLYRFAIMGKNGERPAFLHTVRCRFTDCPALLLCLPPERQGLLHTPR